MKEFRTPIIANHDESTKSFTITINGDVLTLPNIEKDQVEQLELLLKRMYKQGRSDMNIQLNNFLYAKKYSANEDTFGELCKELSGYNLVVDMFK